ncbi:MAG TPA: phosphonate monoester hydrolase, partial [Roseovarius nubinhibens]|nr:phosphonate monoester hydrolase [Roseovarius nubinhibens]
MLPEGAGVASKQNILFVVIDQLRADCVAGALAASARMRNLQALQSDAVSFAHHHSVTNPCGPSRVSILTG